MKFLHAICNQSDDKLKKSIKELDFMKKFNFSIILLIISIITVSAQKSANAEVLINNLLTTLKSSPFRTEFTLSVNQKNAVNSHSISGKFVMSGKKFHIDSDLVKVWYDGKTQWGLNTEAKEVSITEPTDQELIETNPLTIIAAYKSRCNIRLSKTKSTRYDIVELVPKVKNNDFTLIEVRLDKATKNPYSVAVTEKNGNVTLLTLSNYRKDVKVTDADFVFDKAKFKEVTLNDLR